MSLTQLARRRSRLLTGGIVAALAVAGLATAETANAVTPPAGSRAVVQLEQDAASGAPTAAITNGWWGHEGVPNNGTGTIPTALSMDAANSSGTVDGDSVNALLAAMGTDDLSKIHYAIVPTSADGSNEAPTVTAGESAATAFQWVFTPDQNFGQSLKGTSNPNDDVTAVSTKTQLTNWVAAGQPVQSYDNNLVLHDANAPGTPESGAHAKGSSILNTWPAGTHLSLVAYVADGTDASLNNVVPTVAVGADGKAKTAWMPFITVAKPGDALRTSAGYQVIGASAPTVSLSHTFNSAGTTATLTGTVKNLANATATDASGKLQFFPVTNGTRAANPSVEVNTTNGVASADITGFTSGSTKIYDVRYVPDVAASGTYLTSEYVRRTMIAPVAAIATSTKLAITGVTTRTFTATVTPKAPGKVVFKNGSVVMGTVTVSTTTGTAKLAKALTAGKHIITATFTPTNTTTYKTSTVSKTVWQPTVGIALSPAKGKKGTRPKVTIKVVATGTVATGKVIITFDPPTGATKKYTVTLKNGVATLLLPKTVKGVTKVSAAYGGSTTVLSANSKVVTFKAT